MQLFLRLTLTLAVVAAIAAGALSFTYSQTKDAIAEQKKATEADALRRVFTMGFAKQETKTVKTAKGEKVKVYSLFAKEADAVPAYYALVGKGIGYNASVPVELLVGFENPTSRGETAGFTVVGWRCIKSEETPGLGEKIKESRAPATWAEGGPLAKPKPGFDSRTDFQKQFAGRHTDNLTLKKDGNSQGPDAITAATITSRGVVAAIRDAEAKLKVALAVPSSATSPVAK